MNNLIKIDCFAFRKNNIKEFCFCLDKLYCEKGECVFYKIIEKKEN